MIRLIKWLIYGDAHLHHWELFEKLDANQRGKKFFVYVLKCKHCGEMRNFSCREGL